MSDAPIVETDFHLSVVIPMYNEQEVLEILFNRLTPILEGITANHEIVCVNDGSSDATLALLEQANRGNPRIKVVDLSRNFGKELALTAGLDHSSGDAVIPIDADLQDPPELIPEMVELWRQGNDVVLAIRARRDTDSAVKRLTANTFYLIMQYVGEVRLPKNAGDFRLMDRKVINALRRMPERTRFMKGLFAWLGFRQCQIQYDRPPRAAGTTKWRYWKLWNFALDGIFSFTTFPLRIWTYLGITVSAFAALYLIVTVVKTLIAGSDVPGYPSLMSVILFFSGLNMIGLGILGEYLGRVFIEVKHRPLYLVRKTLGIDPSHSNSG